MVTPNIFSIYITNAISLIGQLRGVTSLLDKKRELCQFIWFLCARLETDRIMWLGMVGVHTGFRTITLVLYIGSLQNLATWFPCGRGRTLFILGLLGQGHQYYKYNFWQQGRFRTITLVLYIGSLPNLTTWFPCGRGRTLFILGSLPLYRLII